MLSEHQNHAAAVAAKRRQALLQLVAQGLSQAQIGMRRGITKQRIAVLLRPRPARGTRPSSRLERCPHCRRADLGGKAAVAFAPRFETQLLELLDGGPQSLRYAIPSGWRRGHRKLQLARR